MSTEEGRNRGGGNDGQIIGGGMEGHGCFVGGGAQDDHAVDTSVCGNDGMDEAHGDDFFETDGGEGRRLL